YPNLQTLVVDNGSTDDSVARIRAACPDAHLLAHPENSGFARGTNLGIARALELGAAYVFILNNDTLLAPDLLAQLLAQPTPDAGPLAPIIYYAAAPHTVWSLGAEFNPWLLETRADVRGQEDHGQWPAVLPRDFVPACGLLAHRDLFTRIGMFDARFFMYYEDLDFCLRVRQAGLPLRVVTTAKMWHKVSLSSGGSDSPNERYWMARSSVLYFRKHARPWQWPLVIFWRSGSALRTSWRLLRARRPAALRAYWRGLWHGLRE
ncbi:MAG: glycosyltransferase family 2 protein, partial [Anaerolineales bacterium]|nr:glycosyltransferase family 2 protein [Anaerolineales bacterium]